MVSRVVLRAVALAALIAQLQPLAGSLACAMMRQTPSEACEDGRHEQAGPSIAPAPDAMTDSSCLLLGPCAATAFAVPSSAGTTPRAANVQSLPAPAPAPVSFLTPPLPPPPLV